MVASSSALSGVSAAVSLPDDPSLDLSHPTATPPNVTSSRERDSTAFLPIIRPWSFRANLAAEGTVTHALATKQCQPLTARLRQFGTRRWERRTSGPPRKAAAR